MPRLDQRLGLSRFEADEYYKRALDFYQKRDFDNAIDNLSKAIEALPTRSEYYAARGFIFLEDGEQEKAEADFEEALRRFPYEMLAHYGRGMIAYKAKQWAEAQSHFTKAHYADTSRAETIYYLALVYFHQQDFAKAAEWMIRAQAAFETGKDKRKASADRWLREMMRLAERSAAALKAGGL